MQKKDAKKKHVGCMQKKGKNNCLKNHAKKGNNAKKSDAKKRHMGVEDGFNESKRKLTSGS